MKRFLLLPLLLLTLFVLKFEANAQNVGISDAAITPDASAVLEVRSTNKGLLIPRVALTQTTVAAPVTTPATSLLVFNTASVNDVTPGFYYWSSVQWVRILAGSLPASGWELIGNSGTNPSTNFLGTIDAQDFVIRTSNNERIRVQSGGNVGINTIPTARLHVDGTVRFVNLAAQAGETTALVVDATGNVKARVLNAVAFNGYTETDPLSWRLAGNAGTNPGTNYLGTSDAQALVFRTSAVERMRILSTGNVGIGTTTPSTQFHTTGGVRFQNYASGANGAVLRTDANGNLLITNFTGSATDVLLGNGTFGPAPGGSAGWALTGNAIAATDFIGTTNAQPFVIRTSNTERMRILANGNIGIGNTAPLCYLYFNRPTTLGDFHTQWDNTLAGDAIARFQNTNATNGNRVLFGVTNYNASAFQASAVIGLHLNTAGEGGTGVEGFSNSDDAVGVYAGFTGGNDPFAIGWALLSNGWAGGTTAWQNLSDSRIKKDIKPIENPLSIIKQIKGVEYYYDNSLYPDLNLDTESKQIGFIAQDIEAVLPYLVREANIRGTNGEYSPSMNQKLSVYKLKTFSYSDIVPILLEGMKEQQQIIESLEQRIERLEQLLLEKE